MKYITKIILIGILVGLVIAFVDIGLRFLGNETVVFNAEFISDLGNYILYSVILTIINTSYFDYLNKKVLWEKYGRLRLLIGGIGSIFLSMAGIFAIRFFTKVVIEGSTWVQFLSGEQPGFYGVCLLITLIATIFFHAIYFYKAAQNKKVKEQKIIAGTASAKFDALKNQLDPHFLFNSLNVLTSLIEEDPKQAQKFTTSLSKVYRYVLEQKNKDLVSVDEELQFAKTYIRLLKMRFEDSIVFTVPDKSINPNAKIIPLSLQLLLENAVKHNVVNSNRPLHLKVVEESGRLIVSNNLQEKQVVKKSSGVGLQNIQERYKILSDKTVNIFKTEKEFVVELPILTKQISNMETQANYLDDKRYKNAKERVEKIKGFYGNLMAYCIVIPILALINYKTSSFLWVIFPALGWGFGVLAHGMSAFGYNPLLGKKWEERKMREYMNDDEF
ncbi:2TM domain-containing protein [Cellulophaga sp. HaHaR_3_176]|uniref:2TM domain-containing protein n=1 Tax=Cellulophaga sp. HaHaR_3_176 TaxID=1942464 RepID=UPI001C1F880E|nr:2TM domain-containing protein [Cellulophaga sp. HaHaR_3_176]QWX85560.1 2TM domain-containing protein [Cellulophaga sp. HaHaR_3_176]